MIRFVCHDGLQQELKKLQKRFRTLNEGLEKFKKLCEAQFHPTHPTTVIGPGKLHRVVENATWAIWKIELVIPDSGLRPSQFPRLWFAVKGDVIVFLCIGVHADNYDNNEMDRLATSRATEMF